MARSPKSQSENNSERYSKPTFRLNFKHQPPQAGGLVGDEIPAPLTTATVTQAHHHKEGVKQSTRQAQAESEYVEANLGDEAGEDEGEIEPVQPPQILNTAQVLPIAAIEGGIIAFKKHR